MNSLFGNNYTLSARQVDAVSRRFSREEVKRVDSLQCESLVFRGDYYPLAIRLSRSLGHFCGYIVLPKGHPGCAVEVVGPFDPPSIVHGGITYSAPAGDGWDKDFKGAWVLGFDCAHGFDHVPGLLCGMPGEAYRDIDYVCDELSKLDSWAWRSKDALLPVVDERT
ncbi:MAG: hypothetical protein AAGA67_14060 [Cyanobacteria bacterium P01_F01_bin.153]